MNIPSKQEWNKKIGWDKTCERIAEQSRKMIRDGFVERTGVSRSVMEFAADMLEKLELNSHKEHWSKVDCDYLFMRLKEELDELEAALGGDSNEIIRECADIANFAMMIADNERRRKPTVQATMERFFGPGVLNKENLRCECCKSLLIVRQDRSGSEVTNYYTCPNCRSQTLYGKRAREDTK